LTNNSKSRSLIIGSDRFTNFNKARGIPRAPNLAGLTGARGELPSCRRASDGVMKSRDQ
jgi:hypothetical protein